MWDVLLAHPDVDVELRVNLVSLSPTDPNRACAARLEGLDEDDPDRELWEPDTNVDRLGEVRLLLRVSREGAGHATKWQRVADRICGVLNMFWWTDYKQLVTRRISVGLFDRIWDRGVVERDLPVWHWDTVQTLLGPAPERISRVSGHKRLPDPPQLVPFRPQAPGGLMPVGIASEKGGERLVGVRLGRPHRFVGGLDRGSDRVGQDVACSVAGDHRSGSWTGIVVSGSSPRRGAGDQTVVGRWSR